MLTGTALAQAIPVLVSPVLTRYYTVADFGVYAIYSSLVQIGSSVASGRYEAAIILPKEEPEAINLLVIVCCLTLFLGAAVGVALLFFSHNISYLLPQSVVVDWLYLLPISLVLAGFNMGLLNWMNRHRYYKLIATSRLCRATGVGLATLLLGFVGVGYGLIIGFLVGQVIALFIYLRRFGRTGQTWLKFVSIVSIKRELKRYADFPKYSVPARLIESTSSNLHILVLSAYFGPVVVGFIGLTRRVVRLPIMLMASTTGTVFRQKAARLLAHQGNCQAFFLQTSKWLVCVSILPYLLIFPFLPYLFSAIFGEEWRTAGRYAQIMWLMFFLRFNVSPLSSMFNIAEKQKWDLVMQIALGAVTYVFMVLGYHLFRDPMVVIGCYTATYSSKYLLEYFFSYRFSKGTVLGGPNLAKGGVS